MNSRIDFAQEASIGLFEWALIIVIVLLAGIYLWRKYFIKKGCAGCASSDGKCPSTSQLKAPNNEEVSSSIAIDGHQQREWPLRHVEVIPLQHFQKHDGKKTKHGA